MNKKLAFVSARISPEVRAMIHRKAESLQVTISELVSSVLEADLAGPDISSTPHPVVSTAQSLYLEALKAAADRRIDRRERAGLTRRATEFMCRLWRVKRRAA